MGVDKAVHVEVSPAEYNTLQPIHVAKSKSFPFMLYTPIKSYVFLNIHDNNDNNNYLKSCIFIFQCLLNLPRNRNQI